VRALTYLWDHVFGVVGLGVIIAVLALMAVGAVVAIPMAAFWALGTIFGLEIALTASTVTAAWIVIVLLNIN
jgi:hypothetical protein